MAIFNRLICLAFVCYILGCTESPYEQYEGKVLFVDEGTLITDHVKKSKQIGPDVVRVEYKPLEFKDSLLLWSLSGGGLEVLPLEEFKRVLNGGTIRDATMNEKVNAELCREKRNENNEIYHATVRGATVKIGDLADNVFEVFTKDMRTGDPVVRRDSSTNEIQYVAHTYLFGGIEYTLFFERGCYDCPYALKRMFESTYVTLTFKEYKEKFWVKTKE
ncbi:MAG: hypothetical protein WA126_09690 [Thermodesulfovibrionales bacterium]